MAAAKTKPAGKVAPGKKAAPQPAKRIDWEAVERDYRTDKFTLRQLEAKHGVSYAQICRKASALKWVKDLRETIKRATDTALLQDAVTKAQQEAQQNTLVDTVVVAAEVNKQIILGHRSQAVEVRQAAEAARAKLIALGDGIADMREAAVFTSAVESLSRTYKNLSEMERKAFGIDGQQSDSGEKPTRIELVAL